MPPLLRSRVVTLSKSRSLCPKPSYNKARYCRPLLRRYSKARLPLLLYTLRQRKPVAGIVFEDGFQTIWPLSGRRQKFYATAFHFFVGGLAIVRIKGTGAESAFFDERADLAGRLFIQHATAACATFRSHQGDFKFGLVFGADREPAKAIAHCDIGADCEAELFNIKLVGFVLVGYVNRRVRESFDHGYFNASLAGGKIQQARGGGLLENCESAGVGGEAAELHQKAGRDGRELGWCGNRARLVEASAVVSGRNAGDFAKKCAERTEAGKADFEANLGHGQAAGIEQFFGALDALFNQILMWRLAEVLLKEPQEMEARETGLVSEAFEVERLLVMLIHQAARAAEPLPGVLIQLIFDAYNHHCFAEQEKGRDCLSASLAPCPTYYGCQITRHCGRKFRRLFNLGDAVNHQLLTGHFAHDFELRAIGFAGLFEGFFGLGCTCLVKRYELAIRVNAVAALGAARRQRAAFFVIGCRFRGRCLGGTGYVENVAGQRDRLFAILCSRHDAQAEHQREGKQSGGEFLAHCFATFLDSARVFER
jgi:hypothetical protein